MHYRFQNQCTIRDFECMEDIQNNAIYAVDPKYQKIRKAKDPNEYFLEILVYVNNIPESIETDENRIIKKRNNMSLLVGMY